MRFIKALVVIALWALVSSACNGSSPTGPQGPDPVTAVQLDNIVFERVIERQPTSPDYRPIVWLAPLDNSWQTVPECTMQKRTDGRWYCPAGFMDIPPGEYKVTVLDAAAAIPDPMQGRAGYVGREIWVRGTVHLTTVENGDGGETYAYLRINSDGTLSTTR